MFKQSVRERTSKQQKDLEIFTEEDDHYKTKYHVGPYYRKACRTCKNVDI